MKKKINDMTVSSAKSEKHIKDVAVFQFSERHQNTLRFSDYKVKESSLMACGGGGGGGGGGR